MIKCLNSWLFVQKTSITWEQNDWSNTQATAFKFNLSRISDDLHKTSRAVFKSVAGESIVSNYGMLLSTITAFLLTIILKPVHPGTRRVGCVFSFRSSIQIRYCSR